MFEYKENDNLDVKSIERYMKMDAESRKKLMLKMEQEELKKIAEIQKKNSKEQHHAKARCFILNLVRDSQILPVVLNYTYQHNRVSYYSRKTPHHPCTQVLFQLFHR